MADIEVSYKGSKIVDISESGTTTLKTKGKYCEDDITVDYTKSASEPVIEPLSITDNGTYTASNGVDGYSPVTVNVPPLQFGKITRTRTVSVTIPEDAVVSDLSTYATCYNFLTGLVDDFGEPDFCEIWLRPHENLANRELLNVLGFNPDRRMGAYGYRWYSNEIAQGGSETHIYAGNTYDLIIAYSSVKVGDTEYV